MTPLTDTQRQALHSASRKGGATIRAPFAKTEKGTVARQTADRLTDLGYATTVNGVLLITSEGRAALLIPVPHEPRLLKPKGGYTNRPGLAMRDEPEAIDAELLEFYTQDAHERWAGHPGRRTELAKKRASSLARRLRQHAVELANAGRDQELHARLDALEEHIRMLDRARQEAA